MAEPNLSRRSWTPESPLKTIATSSEHELQLERQAVRKLDYTILPVMAMFSLLSFLDRTNIGNARVAGLQKDLHLTDRQYQICVSIFFVSYVFTELPSNLFLRKIGPRLLMSTLLVAWGIIATLQGVVTSYASLVTARVFLGLAEGPLAPGIILYLSSFYTRRELSLRIALFFSTGSLSGAFSGLLAAAIEKMKGVDGRSGWAWIFILEGLFSILLGIIGFFVIPSTLLESKALTKYQKDIIMRRLERDRPFMKSADKFSLKGIMQSAISPHVIIVFIMYFMIGSTLHGLAFFLPSIVSQLGFNPNRTELLSVGPFAAGFCVTLITAFFSDRYRTRGIPIALVSMLAIAGFALFLSATHKFLSYGALYLMVAGVYGIGPILAAWLANNSELYYRRATSVAMGFIASSSGAILSSWSFSSKEGPRFRKATIMNLTFSIFVVVLALINMTYLSWRNRVKKRPGERARLLKNYAACDKESDDRELRAWMELGDQHPDFVYTI